MAVKQRNSVDETTSLLDSCASTHAELSDIEHVLRHDFASHQYAQRFAPTRFLVSVFEPEQQGPSLFRDPRIRPDDADFYNMVSSVRDAMSTGLNPRMISLGTSGSYFVCDHGNGNEPRIRGVFKPMDEEPYGNLKYVFSSSLQSQTCIFAKVLVVGDGPSLVRTATLTRSLIPNFSYLSEVGASFLDDRLGLGLVPKTRLVGFSSPSFHYLYKDRHRWEQGWQPLPIKIGSLQQFLEGYENAGRFLQKHALPGRSKDVMERDLREEHRAHRLSRRKQGARLRMAFIALKRLLLCRYGPGPYGSTDTNDNASLPKKPPPFTEEVSAYPAVAPMSVPDEDGFEWTEEVFTDMRLELEKLVLLDFLMRNTDRGLDNFMIRYNPHPRPGERRIMIGAIDNSLSFPHQHPQGLRDYPYGWLYLPTGLIGLPFSDETRQLFLPKLTDPIWWAGTIEGLRRIFSQDAHFHERTFQNQMSLLMGQGWLIVQCLRQKSEGPIELCARPKFVVRSSIQMLSHAQLAELTVTDLVQGTTSFSQARRNITHNNKHNDRSAPASAINVKSNRQSHAHPLTQSMPSVLRSPKSPSFLFSPSSNARGIDIVERMALEQKSHKVLTTATPAPYDSPREPPSSKASRRMRPLDLAVGTSVYPLPVLVETVEPVRRRTPFSFN